MTTTTKCDRCHEEKELFFFPVLMGGYVAYCREDAVKMGYINDKDYNRSTRT
jgi:hypothetical protein